MRHSLATGWNRRSRYGLKGLGDGESVGEGVGHTLGLADVVGESVGWGGTSIAVEERIATRLTKTQAEITTYNRQPRTAGSGGLGTPWGCTRLTTGLIGLAATATAAGVGFEAFGNENVFA